MESPSKNILIIFKRYLKNSKSNMNKKRKRKTPKTARAATFLSNLGISTKKIRKTIKLSSKLVKAQAVTKKKVKTKVAAFWKSIMIELIQKGIVNTCFKKSRTTKKEPKNGMTKNFTIVNTRALIARKLRIDTGPKMKIKKTVILVFMKKIQIKLKRLS
jgi:hypothetical protein